MVVITLKSLPKSYEHFIETLNITTTNVDLKFPELRTKLLRQDRWKQQFGSVLHQPPQKMLLLPNISPPSPFSRKVLLNLLILLGRKVCSVITVTSLAT